MEIFRYLLKITAKGKNLSILPISILLIYAISSFLGYTMFVEESQSTIVFFAGTARILMVIIISMIVCNNTYRMIYCGEMQLMLSSPTPRYKIILNYFFLCCFLTLIATLISCILLIFIGANIIPSLIWSLTIFCEVAIISCFAIAASIILENTVTSFCATIAFYLLSRISFNFTNSLYGDKFSIYELSTIGSIGIKIIKYISYVLPNLELYANSQNLIYNEVIPITQLTTIVSISIIYMSMLIILSIIDINKKQF